MMVSQRDPATDRSAASATSRRPDGRARTLLFQPSRSGIGYEACARARVFGRSARRNQDVGQSEAACAAAGQRRLPLGVHRAEGLWVGVDDADQDLADDAATYWAQLLAGVQHLGLLEDVEPQRCLAGPTVLGEPELRGGQGR